MDILSLSLMCGDVAVYTPHVIRILLPKKDPLGWGYVIGFLEGEEHIQSSSGGSFISECLDLTSLTRF